VAQFNIDTGALDPKISSRYEVVMLASGADGDVVSTDNRLPVTSKPDLSVGNFYGEPYAIALQPIIQFNGHDGILSNDIQTYIALSINNRS
jgi:hypothetical protein